MVYEFLHTVLGITNFHIYCKADHLTCIKNRISSLHLTLSGHLAPGVMIGSG